VPRKNNICDCGQIAMLENIRCSCKLLYYRIGHGGWKKAYYESPDHLIRSIVYPEFNFVAQDEGDQFIRTVTVRDGDGNETKFQITAEFDVNFEIKPLAKGA
jgi:hypothetical protein